MVFGVDSPITDSTHGLHINGNYFQINLIIPNPTSDFYAFLPFAHFKNIRIRQGCSGNQNNSFSFIN